MSALGRLIARATGTADGGVRPRLPMRFETPATPFDAGVAPVADDQPTAGAEAASPRSAAPDGAPDAYAAARPAAERRAPLAGTPEPGRRPMARPAAPPITPTGEILATTRAAAPDATGPVPPAALGPPLPPAPPAPSLRNVDHTASPNDMASEASEERGAAAPRPAMRDATHPEPLLPPDPQGPSARVFETVGAMKPPAPPPAAPPEPEHAPDITIHIGRIDLRSAAKPVERAERRPREDFAAASLADYLKGDAG